MPRTSADQLAIDRVHMARCLELAERYRGRTAPNPIVGSVIVDKRGEVIAEGAHKAPGTDHAERAALRKLGGMAPGATLYVNLEPCLHHGRTPPCAPAVREAGITRVVIGTEDPIPEHGGGIEHLRRAGVTVNVGVLRAECERANKPFFTWAQHERPAFTLKAAMTLDGKIATVKGESKWITGELARADVMRLRDGHDAVMVGIGTVIADDPRLTARRVGGRDPIRILLDARLDTPTDARALPARKGGKVRTIIACGPKAAEARERALVAKGAEVWRTKLHPNGRIDVHELAKKLADQNVTSVLVEGGGEVHAYMLERGLADELVLYVAPKVVGGPAKSWVGGKGLATLYAAYRFVFDEQVTNLEGDLRLTATLAPPREEVTEPFPDDD